MYLNYFLFLSTLFFLVRSGSFTVQNRKYSCAKLHTGNVTINVFEGDNEDCTQVIYENRTFCKSCPHEHLSPLICNVNSSSTTAQVLSDIPGNLRYLTLVVDTTWHGHLPLSVSPLNISLISRQTMLKKFVLTGLDFGYFQLYPLQFDKHSFKSLVHLEELALRIPIQDKDLGDMVAPLRSLKWFDISFTRGLSLDSLTKTLARINKTSIQYLCLRTFQLIGGDGYSSELNMSTLAGNQSTVFPNLLELDLSDNSLARIRPGISNLAPHLKTFDVSGNVLLDSHNVALLLESLMHKNLQEFNFGYQGYIGGFHPINDQRSVRTEPYQQNIDITRYQYLPHITNGDHHLNIQNQILMHCINIVTKQNVSNGFNSSQILCNFLNCVAPNQFQGFPCHVLPSLNEIFDFSCYLYSKIPLGKKLKTFLFGHVHWEDASTHGLAFRGNICFTESSLETFVFSSNAKWIKSGYIAYTLNHMTSLSGLDKLSTFALDDNNLDITLEFLDRVSLPMLRHLNLSSNRVRMSDSLRLCRGLPQLSNISVAHNNLKRIPNYFVSNCPNLKYVSLAWNQLNESQLHTWDLNGSDHLEMIDLSYNNLKGIDDIFQTKLIYLANKNPRSPLHVNLKGNPLSCGCDNIPFLQWITSNQKNLIFVNSSYYTFFGEKGPEYLSNVDIKELIKSCNKSHLVPLAIGLGSGFGVLLIFACLFSLYTRRWIIRYHTYQFKQKMLNKCCRWGNEGSSVSYTYDAFVSYCADDRFWVHDVLMKTLENIYGFHLCIHYRDFPVGGSIFETISERMSASRVIVLVVSDLSISSRMCQFELEEAQKHAHEENKQLLLIKLGTITKTTADSTVAFLLDRHTYLEWSENATSHKLFWAKLVGHLYDDFQGSSNRCCCPYGARALGYEELQ